MTAQELASRLDRSLEKFRTDLNLVRDGDTPLSKDESIHLADLSLSTLMQFRDAIVEFAKSSK